MDKGIEIGKGDAEDVGDGGMCERKKDQGKVVIRWIIVKGI